MMNPKLEDLFEKEQISVINAAIGRLREKDWFGGLCQLEKLVGCDGWLRTLCHHYTKHETTGYGNTERISEEKTEKMLGRTMILSQLAMEGLKLRLAEREAQSLAEVKAEEEEQKNNELAELRQAVRDLQQKLGLEDKDSDTDDHATI